MQHAAHASHPHFGEQIEFEIMSSLWYLMVK